VEDLDVLMKYKPILRVAILGGVLGFCITVGPPVLLRLGLGSSDACFGPLVCLCVLTAVPTQALLRAVGMDWATSTRLGDLPMIVIANALLCSAVFAAARLLLAFLDKARKGRNHE